MTALMMTSTATSTVLPTLAQLTLSANPTDIPTLQEWMWVLPQVQSVEAVYEGPLGIEVVNTLRVVFGVAVTANDSLDAWQADITRQLATAPVEHLSQLVITDIKPLQDEDWAESWKKHWSVTRVSKGLVIVPSWEAYTPLPHERVLTLDPGQAFGTGSHQTTRLMLRQLDTLRQTSDFSRMSALDVGCGSGVLAIGAALMGVPSIVAIDIQPASIVATAENAALNGVAHHITVSDTPLQDLCQTQHELILANIVAPVIHELLDDMLLRLAPNGRLLLSGLIAPNIAPLTEALEAKGLSVTAVVQEGDWYLMDAQWAT